MFINKEFDPDYFGTIQTTKKLKKNNKFEL